VFDALGINGGFCGGDTHGGVVCRPIQDKYPDKKHIESGLIHCTTGGGGGPVRTAKVKDGLKAVWWTTNKKKVGWIIKI